MNYDDLLSELTDEKLELFQTSSKAAPEEAIEEEQAATIQTVCKTFIKSTNVQTSKSEGSTPQRKVSTSSRLMSAFQQFYATGNSSVINDGNGTSSTAPTSHTPTKGVESKLLSMWQNVKYGWSGKLAKTNFSKEQPVWLLGRCYHRKCSPSSSMETSTEMSISNTGREAGNNKNSSAHDSVQHFSTCYTSNNFSNQKAPTSTYPIINLQQAEEIIVPQELGMDAAENQVAENLWEEGIEGFKRDFYTRIWMTYRREFPTMNGSNYTSDCGWGCMIRSGQMLLAQALLCHFLGRSWRYDPDSQLHSTYEDNMHKKIIKWFGDISSKSSPFSIHTLVHLGEQMGKRPGDWYGPASVSYLLRQALKNAAQENADFDNLALYVAKESTVYIGDIEAECCVPERTPKAKANVPWRKREVQKATEPKQQWKSLIILIPLRLGTEKLNPVYAHCLKLLLSTEYCIGIIGGRPKHSLYFVGFQEDKLIHLDPHYCQEMVDVNQENFALHSFHCKSPRKLKTAKIDPSCCIGFYCQNKIDFDSFVESVQLYLHPMRCASGTIDKILPPSQQMSNNIASSFTEPSNTSMQYAEMNYPLFSFSRGRCLQHEINVMNDSLYRPLQKPLQEIKAEMDYTVLANMTTMQAATNDDDSETEEFVLL